MVTLLGFFFILGNIGLLVIFMPDLVGPVGVADCVEACGNGVLTLKIGADVVIY